METSTAILLSENIPAQSQIRESVKRTQSGLSYLLRSYRALEWPQGTPEAAKTFTMQDVQGVPTIGKSSNGCQSCQGVRAYNFGQFYIADRLLDNMDSSVGGLRLDREKLKALIELPSAQTVEQFNKALEAWRKNEKRYMQWMHIENDQVVVDTAAVEQACEDQKIYAESEEGIALVEDLQKLMDLTQSINERLIERRLPGIKFSEDYNKPHHILYTGDGKRKISKHYLSQHIR